MAPPKNFDHGCWVCGVTATHHTLTTTPEHMRTPTTGEWMCFGCIGQHERKRKS